MREKQREELEEQARRQKAEDERAREQRQQEIRRKKEMVCAVHLIVKCNI